ncbi:MAG TPA: ADP-ribose pyrophosphatase [Actinobacteria bacterium]|nr:ADP-ribose pyrophosphatase [Actinomycetota bacterium]
MGDDRYRVVKSEVKFEGEIISLFVDEVEMPWGDICEREYVRHKGAVGIVALTDENEVYLVKQYRHPTGEMLLEIPAGKLDGKEDPLGCAIRELKEETGSVCREMVKLAEFYTTPGYSDEFFHLYLATGLEVGAVELEDDEEQELEVLKVSLNEAFEMISAGKIRDGKTIAGLALAEKLLKGKM